MGFDGVEWWENVDLRPSEQKSYYEDLLAQIPRPAFSPSEVPRLPVFLGKYLVFLSDAFTLSGVIRKEKPRRIVEVGSGFSSAVMLDTLDHNHGPVTLTFIEPRPERLYSLLSPDDRSLSTVIVREIQEVPLSVFEQLDAQDLLFIDSSHVCKIGSDVASFSCGVYPG